MKVVSAADEAAAEDEINNMKQSRTIISGVIAFVGLIAAFAIGLYIKEVKSKYRAAESEAVVEQQTKQAVIPTRPPSERQRNSRDLNPEQRAQLTEQMKNIRQQWPTMSEQERKEFKTKIAEIFQVGRSETNKTFETSHPEGRDSFAEEFLKAKNNWEDMTEEERQEYRDKIRVSYNAVRQGND